MPTRRQFKQRTGSIPALRARKVHGACRDAIAYAQWVADGELNSVNDSRSFFIDDETGEPDVVSAGIFYMSRLRWRWIMKLALGNRQHERTSHCATGRCQQQMAVYCLMFLT